MLIRSLNQLCLFTKKLCFTKPLSFIALLFVVSISFAHTPANVDSVKKQKLIAFVHKTVDNQQYSSYKLGGSRFDAYRGIYIVDCSSYVNHLLKYAYPKAFTTLVNSSRSVSPTSLSYYNFFTALPEKPKPRWHQIKNVSQLRPGDILVFRYRKSVEDDVKGHVMVVMKKPIQHANSFEVRVADSAPIGHSHDTRGVLHRSGIGIGNFLLKVNAKTGRPLAYAWNVGSHWERHVIFAMARPIALS